MARMTKDEVEGKIDAALSAGEIYNVDLIAIKEALTRMVDAGLEQVSTVYYPIIRAADDTMRRLDPFHVARYASHYPHNIPAFGKKLPKAVEPMWQPVLAAYHAFLQEWVPICEKFVALKNVKVLKGRAPVTAAALQGVDIAALRAEKADLQSKVSNGKYGVTMGQLSKWRARIRDINKLLGVNDKMKFGTSHIAKAFLPMKTEAMAYAKSESEKWNNELVSRLEKADWNLDTLAPKAPKDATKEQIESADRRRAMYGRVSKRDDQRLISAGFTKPSKFNPGHHVLLDDAPSYVTYDAGSAERHVKADVEAAAEFFDTFVSKMDAKVGDHDSAEVEGKPWIGATVTITKGALREVWHTQQIINRSVYGKLFNQWPTRLVSTVEV